MIRKLAMLLLLAALIGFAVYSEIRQRTRTSAENNSDPVIEKKNPETDAAQKTGPAGGAPSLPKERIEVHAGGLSGLIDDFRVFEGIRGGKTARVRSS